MNNRIQELAEQATTKISFRLDPNTYKHIDDPEGDLERFEFDKEKFAELIVWEAIGVCQVNVDALTGPFLSEYEKGIVEGYRRANENLRVYFEVEE